MKSKNCLIKVVVLSLFLYTSALNGQNNTDVYWHTDASVKSCSMVIDPSLTQDFIPGTASVDLLESKKIITDLILNT